jgi:hypothetical protein
MRVIFLLFTILCATFYQSNIAGQQKRSPLRETAGHVVSVASRPTLATDWQKVAQLKLAARKGNFYNGEMINIDIAMMNQSSEDIFFRSINSPSFVVTDEAGKSIAVVPYVVREFTYTTDLFELVRPSDIVTQSFALLAGCDQRAFDQMSSNSSSRELFDKNLFLNWGDSCVQIAGLGTYFLTAEFNNNMVRTSSNPKTRTAVGTIRSAPLKITIVQ